MDSNDLTGKAFSIDPHFQRMESLRLGEDRYRDHLMACVFLLLLLSLVLWPFVLIYSLF